MTTHVFIVNEETFDKHLRYRFVGTGAGDKYPTFVQNVNYNPLHYFRTENQLVGMMADGSRIREGDNIIFYLQATAEKEGKFYGVFKATRNNIYLATDPLAPAGLTKQLPFRQLIEGGDVYSEGVTEWEALDEIKYLNSPHQMLWSLIYRKLRANRGNTMITIYEAGYLISLLKRKNNFTPISSNNPNQKFVFQNDRILLDNTQNASPILDDKPITIDILPRFQMKYNQKNAHEAHLQMYITQNLGMVNNSTLNEALNIRQNSVEWIGNEVACGVGMQRIDVMFSQKISDNERILTPIELKCICLEQKNVDRILNQINRYIEWIEQYYIPNSPTSIIQPMLLCKANFKQNNRQQTMTNSIIFNAITTFNQNGINRYLPLQIVEYYFNNQNLIFERI